MGFNSGFKGLTTLYNPHYVPHEKSHCWHRKVTVQLSRHEAERV